MLSVVFQTHDVWAANGKVSLNNSHTVLPMPTPGKEFGKELATTALGIGLTMDVAVVDGHVFAIGAGELRVLTNPSNGKPALLARLSGLGNTRQIAVAGGHAYVTAREDGLFIIDVREPSRPRLVNHYDTAELATAIAVSGNVAAVGNRFAGIELLDVSQPEAPRYLSCIRAGEVQSLVFHGSWLYAGAWSEKEVAVIDVSNPGQPVLVNHVPLDGYGDGLDVDASGTLLAAATGHHAPSKGRPNPGDAAFGAGHGIEFFDIRNPAQPRRLSGVKFPPFYRLGMDMWGVVLSGGYAFVNDTHNGVFIVDVRDPERPRNIGWSRLPKVKDEFSPAAGIAVSNGRVFIAGGFDDLHQLDTELAQEVKAAAGAGLQVPTKTGTTKVHDMPAYVVDGSIRSVVPWKDDLLLVAAGSAGWHIVRQTTTGFEPVAVHPTQGFARDVAFAENRIFVAESLGGLSVWERQTDRTFKRLSAYQVPGKSIHQVVIADQGRTAFAAVGSGSLHVIRISDEGQAKGAMAPFSFLGLFYRDPMSPLSEDGQSLLVQWHATGLYEFVMGDEGPRRGDWSYLHRMGTGDGTAPWRGGWLVTAQGGYYLLRKGEQRAPSELGIHEAKGMRITGKPSIHGDTLFVSDAFQGNVMAFDISTETRPQLLGKVQVSGHPGRVRVQQGKALVPAGRDGLLLWKFD